MTVRRILRAVLRPFKRLVRRVFVQHQWIESGDARRCSVCNRIDFQSRDDWGSAWHTISKGNKHAHARRGAK